MISFNNMFECRKFYWDALPLCGTAGGIGVMVDIMGTSDISKNERDAWLAGMALNTPNPNADILSEAKVCRAVV